MWFKLPAAAVYVGNRGFVVNGVLVMDAPRYTTRSGPCSTARVGPEPL